MGNVISIFEFPEIKQLAYQLFDNIFDESERGAIIIATAHIDDHLTKYIEAVLPEQSKKYKSKIIQYPGPLSSFSSKIELAYAFRLIDLVLYKSLNNLRKIRNEASHTSSKFTIVDLKDQMREVFNIGPQVPVHIRKHSIELMLKIKFESLNLKFDQDNVSTDDRRKIFTSIIENDSTIKNLEDQIPHWEILYGICLLCGTISIQRDRYLMKMKI